MDGFATRVAIALALVAAAAVAAFALAASLETALVVLVAGAAAVMVAAYPADVAPETVPHTPQADWRATGDLLDAIVEPVLLLEGGQVTFANRAARALLGAHIVGEDVRVAIRHPAAAERFAAGRSGDDDAPIDLVGLGARDQRWSLRVADLAGGVRLVHLIDQTGSYAAERMRVDFVANASHELRTPLASVLGYVETLRDAAGDDAETRARFLKIIDDEARRMERLVEDLISLSRIEAEKFRAPADAVDLAALLGRVREELAGDYNGRAADLAPTIGEGAMHVVGDEGQLSQLLHNLMGNAMKYGRHGTPVTVALDRLNGNVRLTVSDEGDGIAPQHLPRLTERFYRVEPSRSRALGGTGLGLAIVKHIVERHRGRLDIASTVGVGTRVTVSLPAAGDAAVIKP